MRARVLIVALLFSSPASAESFRSWAARAAREEREKDDAAAARSYSNAISSWKESDGKTSRAKVFCARGALKERAGEDAEAVKDFTECLATDKKNAKVFRKRGLLRMKAGQTALAIDDFYQAVSADLKFAQAYADRGRAYESQGEKGFAREDHQRACELGIKASCVRAKELAPLKGKPLKRKDLAPAADMAEPAKVRPVHHPRFNDCIRGLERCEESGKAFGPCVEAAPACEKKAVKDCCPQACLSQYRKEVNRGLSEAEAYREIFTAGANCATPPKSEDDE